MNRTLKLVAAAIGALVILAAAAIAIVVATINPNDYKDRIADAARSATGRELVFDGDLSLSFFPWLGVAFGPMHLGNPPDFPKAAPPPASGTSGDDDIFLRIKGGGLRVAFMPLLSKRVEVAELMLDGLHLNLVRAADGRTNWDFAKPGQAPAAPASPAPQAAQPSASGGAPMAVAVDTLSVKGASLSFRDLSTGQQFRARDLNVNVNGLAPGGDPADIKLAVAMSGQKPDIEADLSLTAKVQSDLDGSVLRIDGLTVTLTPKGGVAPAGLGKVELAGDLTVHTVPQRVDIARLSLSTPTMKVGVNGTAALGAQSFEGLVTLAGSPRKALESLGTPVRTADPKVLDALDLKLDVQAAPTKVDVRTITGKLDDTAIQGKASAVPGAVQVIRAELALDAIDVDRYLPPEGDKGKAPEKGAAPTTGKGSKDGKDGKAAPQDGTAEAKKSLRAIDADVTFKAGRLVASKVPMTNVLVRLVADKGLVRINPLQLNLGGGAVNGDITADTRAEATKSRIVTTVKGVEVGELQQAALGKRHVSARADVKTDLTATGDDWNAAKHTLAGTASLAMTQGTIHGFQIIPEGIKGAESRRAGASGQKFDSLTASIRADKGVVSNKDLKFVSPGIGATGAGTADLGRNVVDYAATLDVTGLPKIPIKISGSLDSPSYGVDPTKMLMNTLEGAGGVIKAPVEKGGEAVKGIGGAIKGLLPGQKQ